MKRFPWTAAAAIVITVFVVALDLRFALHAGGLWRDESATAHFATLPAVGDIVSRLHLDNFPCLSLAVIRAWSAAFGPGDAGYRALGFLVALGVLAALWLHGALIGNKGTGTDFQNPILKIGTCPLISLVLFAANPVVVRAISSIRPYGIGATLLVLAHALVWRATEAPSRRSFATAAIVSVLAVQTLYQNAILLGAIGVSAAAAIAVIRPRSAWIPLAIGGVAAVSLLPYAGFVRRAQEWSVLNRGSVTLDHLVSVFGSMLSSAGPAAVLLAALAALVAAAAGLRRSRQDGGRTLYALLTLVLATLGFLFFLRLLSMPTQIWYYVLPSAVAAVSIDTILAAAPKPRVAARGVAALVGLALVASGAWAGTAVRQTNADLVAAAVRAAARPGDLVLVHPWYCAITLTRYGTGSAAIVSIPPLDDLSIHRYDLLKARMQETDPMAALRPRIDGALRSGARVWYAGDLELPPPGTDPQAPPPAPVPGIGWNEGAYLDAWSAQAAGWLRSEAREVRQVQVEAPGPVNPLETLPLYVFSGWRGPA
ncbi:MAG TPA: hypothetical protein VFV19_07000 [Candidatus Polarisedimenticolaceae bacterium]|nr:hypothetical protein [Candidatus Polarisedimenticolaceae bacterium]